MKDQEEDRSLLEEFELSHQPTQIWAKESQLERTKFQQVRHELQTQWRRWRHYVAGFMLLAIMTLAVFVSMRSPRKTQNGRDGQIAIALNPGDHASRQPTTLRFEWNITADLRSPDGVEKRVYLVNNEFPGPTIEALSGDRIVVQVHNGLEDEGLSLHWHGLRMEGHNRMDGAVGFTQCELQAGGEMVYDFTIGDEEHGTFWWHSHIGVQRGDGLFGGLIVHSPTEKDTPADDALVMVGDWFHQSSEDVVAWYADAKSLGREPVPDSMVINGRGRYNCSMAVPSRPVVCEDIETKDFPPLLKRRDGSTRLRVVNTGTIAGVRVKVDGARIRAVRVDSGFPVEAKTNNTVGIVYPGERVDFVVEWKEEPSSGSWFTVQLDDENFNYRNEALDQTQSFPLFVGSLNASEATSSGESFQEDKDVLGLDTISAEPDPSPALPQKAQETLLLYVKTQKLAHLDNRPVGFINHTSWAPQSIPLLAQNRSVWDKNQLVPFLPLTENEPKRVDVIINNLDDGSHPFHLHGNSFYVLSSYRSDGRDSWGSYNPYDGSEPPNGLNLKAPVRKDTISVPRRGHVVLSLVADNPGLWMLHCHMLPHMATGMGMGLHVGETEDEEHVARVEDEAAALCKVT